MPIFFTVRNSPNSRRSSLAPVGAGVGAGVGVGVGSAGAAVGVKKVDFSRFGTVYGTFPVSMVGFGHFFFFEIKMTILFKNC